MPVRWVTHRREIKIFPFTVSDTVDYSPSTNGSFIPLTSYLGNPFNLPPMYFSEQTTIDSVIPRLNCSAIAGWETWIQENCRVAFIWGPRAQIDPWDCTDLSSGITSSRCNTNVSLRANPILQDYSELHLGFTCRAPQGNSDEESIEQQRIMRVISSFNFRLGMIQNPVNGSSRCAPLSSQPAISQQACNAQAYQGRSLICGVLSQEACDQQSITKWSRITLPDTFLQRCNQLLFSR